MISKIIFDDEKEAQRIISEGLSDTSNFYELSLVSKYYRKEGYGFARIFKELISLCKRKDKYFNEVTNHKILKDAVNSCKKFKLREKVNRVFITEQEVEALKSVSNRYAKVLFVMLVVAKKEKFSNTRIKGRKPPEKMGYFFNYPIELAIKVARIRMTKKEIERFKYEMYGKLGYLEALLWGESSWRVSFADDRSKIEIIVDNFEEIMSFLPFFCEICGKIVEKTGKRQKYCTECWNSINKEQIKSRVRKHREKM